MVTSFNFNLIRPVTKVSETGPITIGKTVYSGGTGTFVQPLFFEKPEKKRE
jgi:hypothetical protein